MPTVLILLLMIPLNVIPAWGGDATKDSPVVPESGDCEELKIQVIAEFIPKGDPIDRIHFTTSVVCSALKPGGRRVSGFDSVTIASSVDPEVSVIETEGCLEDPSGVPLCTLGTIDTDTPMAYYVIKTCVQDDSSPIAHCAAIASSVPGDPVPANNISCTLILPTVLEPYRCNFIFLDGFESGDTSAWSKTEP